MKNHLFSKASHQDRKTLQTKWSTISDNVSKTVPSKAPSSTAANVRFLRYHVMAEYDTEKVLQASSVYEYARKEILKKNSSSPDALEFARKMEKHSQAYARMHAGQYPGKRARQEHIYALTLLKTPVRQHYPLLLAAHGHPAATIDVLAKGLERLVVVYLLAGERWNQIESKIPEWSAKIRGASTTKAMQSFVSGPLETEIKEHLADARQGLVRLGDASEAVQRYVLARITGYVDHLGGQGHDLNKFFDSNVTIEHILPQDPTADWEAVFAKVDLEEYTYELGNLTLLYLGSNSSVGRKRFSEKRKYYKKGKNLLTASLYESVAEGSAATKLSKLQKRLYTPKDWTPKDVKARTKVMEVIAAEMWDL